MPLTSRTKRPLTYPASNSQRSQSWCVCVLKMGPFLLSNSSSLPPQTKFPRCNCKTPPPLSTTSLDGALARALGNGVSILLSFGLLSSSPQPCLSISMDSPSSVRSSPPVYLTDKNANCYEDEEHGEMRVNASRMVTNEGIVEEAWEVVYESFLDTTRRHRWSPETWLVSSKL